MSKNYKKLLSVVLAVLVLAAGLASTFSAFKPVSAENVWTYDYTVLVPEFDSVNERRLLPYGVSMSNGSFYEAPASFGFLDHRGLATNLSDVLTGIRVSDHFFTKLNNQETFTVGDYDITKDHPYIIYEVAPNSEFKVQYETYTKESWVNLGITDDVYLIDILLSSDGVNYVPANPENEISPKASASSYDRVTSTIANVGAAKYVKLQIRLNPSHKTTSYVPQDGIFIQKVKAVAPTTATEKKASFIHKAITVNGEAASLKDVFFNYPSTTTISDNIGFATYDYSKLSGDRAPWGTYPESDRDYYIRVQPGTRFFLSFNDQPVHDELAKALVAASKAGIDGFEGYDDNEDFAVKVYTSANRFNGWVEHKMDASSNFAGEAMRFSYNFIVPENHTYIKIVTPISGAVNSIKNFDAEGNILTSAVTEQVGNTIVATDRIFFTPYDESTVYNFDTVYDYDTNKIYALDVSGAVTNHNFAFQKGYAFHATNGEKTYVLGDPATERKDEDLAYAVFQAAGGTMFRAKLQIGYTGNWRKEGHDKAKSANAEEMHFAILTSSDMTDWTLQNTLGTDDDFYVCDSTSNGKNYNVDVFVPENHKYVKIISYCRGYYIESGGNNVFFDDQFGIHGVSFSVKKGNGSVTYDYTDTSAIAAGTEIQNNAQTQAKLGIYSTSTRQMLYCNGTAISGIVLPYANPYNCPYPTLPEQYLIYEVKPGTTFVAKFYLASDTKTNNAYVKQRISEAMVAAKNAAIANGQEWTASTDYEFIISSSTSADSGWKKVETTKGTNSAEITYSYEVPEDCNFVKITFPDKGRVNNVPNTAGSTATTSYVAGDGLARVKSVSFVPAGYVEGAENYDYRSATLISTNSNVHENKEVLGVYDATPGVVYNEGANIKGVNVNMGSINEAWGEDGPFEVIYHVKPGTTFSADMYLASGALGLNTWNKQTLAHLAGEPWEFTIESAVSADSGWKNKIDTSSITTAEFTLNYNVPIDCNFVKITFPQKGYIETACDCDIAKSQGYHMREANVQGNDLARIRSVSYIPADSDVFIANDYAKGDATLNHDESKVAYEIYDFDGVKGTANGLTSENGGYVIYKVSNEEALVINSADKLDIAVSYDGENFVDAQIKPYAGAYTVNVIEGKQYVKVALDAGETITAVKAASLAPTATFVNYAGTKVDVQLDAYGATPAEPAIKDRVGYTFDKWDTEVSALYLDKTYTAQYNKNTTNTFAVKLVENENATISYPDGVTAETVRFDDRVTLTAAATNAEGEVFDKWIDEDGNTIANSRNFSFLASDALTITAVYAPAKTEDGAFIYNNKNATITDNGAKWSMSVVWRVNVPAGTTIKETGLVLAATNTTMELDADGTVKRAHSSAATGKTLMYTVNNIVDGATRYARPYAVLEDGTVIYGTTVTAAN